MSDSSAYIVVAKCVHKTYDSGHGVLVNAPRGVDCPVTPGETVGIVAALG